MQIVTLSLLAAVAFATAATASEPSPGMQVEQQLKTEHGTIPYLIYLPKDYAERAEVPLMLFLHGRGESNGPLRLVEKWGPPKMIARGDEMRYIVISPQCPRKSRWTDDDQQAMLLDLMDHIGKQFKVDQSRVYLTGLSMGGYGSWLLAANHADRFAAAAIVCGGGDPDYADRLATLPIWVFHGTEDTAVPFGRSVEMVRAIRAAGGNQVRFTELRHIGHNAWSAAYATPELYTWFDRQAR